MRFLSSSVISIILTSGSLTATFPANSPLDALAKLEGRSKCNADLCLGMMTNRPSQATAYCTSLIASTPKTVTVTAWSTSLTVPVATATQFVGTTTTTEFSTSTFTTDITIIERRVEDIATTAPIASLVPLSCTSSLNAPVTARASSACSCLLSTSVTVTVTSTTVSFLPTLTTTETTSFATTTTSIVLSVPTDTVTTTESCTNGPLTVNGVSFDIVCGAFACSTILLTITGSTFEECLASCAANPKCVAANWIEEAVSCAGVQAGNLLDCGEYSGTNFGYISFYDIGVIQGSDFLPPQLKL